MVTRTARRRLARARRNLLFAFRVGVNPQTRLHCLNEFHAAWVEAFGEPQRLPTRVVWTKRRHSADPLHSAQAAPLAGEIPINQVSAVSSGPTDARPNLLEERQLAGGLQHEKR